LNKQPFFSNQPMSLYYSLLDQIEKIRECRHTPYSRRELTVFIIKCHDLLKQYTQPGKIIALHFMQAEFLARLSLLAIDEGKGEEAYGHYERASHILSAAAEYYHDLNDQQIEEIKEEIKKSNSEGLTNPIKALDRIKEIIDPPLTLLLQQTSKPSKTT
jgi:HD-GYP domain-containing protein (c-di-GMP phosphodiesterase class II)